MTASVPCALFEDDDLLVINKPAGLNTHSPAPYASEGLYEWLRSRERRWASLAIIHRLDKETSGVLLLAKSPRARRSLTEQFAGRQVRKSYLFVTDRPVREKEWQAKSYLSRVGERYQSSPRSTLSGQLAETRFVLQHHDGTRAWIAAEPVTGRTHQIRVHAADHGVPILGDTLYGGTPAPRVFLHAASLSCRHPAGEKPVTFSAPAPFELDSRLALRSALIDPRENEICRLAHGASDGLPGCYVDKIGPCLLAQTARGISHDQRRQLGEWVEELGLTGAWHKQLERAVGSKSLETVRPRLLFGDPAPERFAVLENGLKFWLSFEQGYSCGLFHDQRENRRRCLQNYVAPGFEVVPLNRAGQSALNLFAYTCSFSICAARLGLTTVSVDLSKKYLEWGKENFALNGLDPGRHEFWAADALSWLARARKRKREFDLIVVDPPTFSRSSDTGVFRAESDFGKLVEAAAPLLKRGGTLLAAANAARLAPVDFLGQVRAGVAASGRRVIQEQYVPQPADFPISREEPGYFKSVWLKLA